MGSIFFVIERPNILPPSENAVCTAVTLDFFILFRWVPTPKTLGFLFTILDFGGTDPAEEILICEPTDLSETCEHSTTDPMNVQKVNSKIFPLMKMIDDGVEFQDNNSTVQFSIYIRFRCTIIISIYINTKMVCKYIYH